ncbi:MAG: aldo/keto reductase family oxidoreductase [Oscillospiraceae bacterium]
MKQLELSRGLSISAIVQGFWRLDSWNLSWEELARFMQQRIERGVTTFDTAEIYGMGECETQMGNVFKRQPALRQKVQLVSKTGIYKQSIGGGSFGYYDTTYSRVKQSCKESLARLGTDYLDLYLIHREDPCLNPWETGRALLDLKKEGLVREIGVSNFDPFKFEAMQKATQNELVTNQIEWSPVCFEHFNSGMVDLLTSQKIHPMVWSPLAGGALFNGEDAFCKAAREKIEEIALRHQTTPESIVYAWVLYHPAGAAPIVGSSKLARLENALQGLAVQLQHYEWYEIYAASGQQSLR